jgi:hypothetical protein
VRKHVGVVKGRGHKILWRQREKILVVSMGESPEITADDERMQDALVQYLQIVHRLVRRRINHPISQGDLLAGAWLRRLDREFQAIGTGGLANENRFLRSPTPQENGSQGEKQYQLWIAWPAEDRGRSGLRIVRRRVHALFLLAVER